MYFFNCLIILLFNYIYFLFVYFCFYLFVCNFKNVGFLRSQYKSKLEQRET